MIEQIYEKTYKRYILAGLIIISIGINLAIQQKNTTIAALTIIAAIVWMVLLVSYRKKHDLVGKDERLKRISQMASSTTFAIFVFGFLFIGLLNVFYPLEKTITAHGLASILSGIGLAMLFCNAVFYMYYKRRY
ncbi:DUF2178 domain-containing protein [Methanococcoides cohabitans]|uniref:DUF2178 domain-containing protein n=1 Tax=Methanococcoides cohabitans TaxID=3136559 RepID=A0ABU9KQU9_9EURY